MIKKLLLGAMFVFMAAVVVLVLILGGCGRNRDRDKAADAESSGRGRGKPPVAIGEDSSVIARLDRPARVTATVFRPEREDGESGVEVDLLPGAWLLPARAFQNPGCGTGDADER